MWIFQTDSPVLGKPTDECRPSGDDHAALSRPFIARIFVS